MNRNVIKVIGYWLVVIGYWLVVNVQCSTVNAQINPEIKALMAYADSMKKDNSYITPFADMRFDVGTMGLECTGRIGFQYSYILGLPHNYNPENPERIAIKKQKGDKKKTIKNRNAERAKEKGIQPPSTYN